MSSTRLALANGLDRREFLQLTGGTVGTLLAASTALAHDFNHPFPVHRFRVRRDWDLLSLEFTFHNFERRGEELVALGGGQSLIIVRFPPQNLAEARFDKPGSASPPENPRNPKPLVFSGEAVIDEHGRWLEERLLQPGTGTPPVQYSPVPPVPAFLSGPSWIVFSAADTARVPLTLAAAERLGWRCGGRQPGQGTVVDRWLQMMGQWPIRVPANAVQAGTPKFPDPHETSLEIPFRLFISPASWTAKWITSSAARLGFEGPGTGAVELWHAALHDRKQLIPANLPSDITNLPKEFRPPKRVTVQARAVYSPDYNPAGEPPWERFYPGNLPLSHRALVRHLLVKQMSEGDGWIDAEHLILTALGADASLSYTMQTTFRQIYDKQLSDPTFEDSSRLAIWKHRMVIGRDVFLLSVYPGFLMPFAFPALLVEVTRRTFAAYQKEKISKLEFSSSGAYLITEYYILVQDGEKRYGEPNDVVSRKMPVKRATLLDKKSPLIQPPDNNKLFIPRMLDGGQEVRWAMEFEDGTGKSSHTTDACLLFAQHVVRGHEAWELQPEQITTWSLAAQTMALAPDEAELKFNGPRIGDQQQPPIQHTFFNSERRILAELAAKYRAVDPKDKIEKVVKRLQAELQQEVKGLKKSSHEKLQASVDRILQAGDQVAVGFDELLTQLGRADQAATDVEVHAIQFASRRVDQMFKTVKDDVDGLLNQASGLCEFKDKLREAMGVNAELSNFVVQVTKDVKVIQGKPIQTWDEQRKELVRLFDKWSDELKKKWGNSYKARLNEVAKSLDQVLAVVQGPAKEAQRLIAEVHARLESVKQEWNTQRDELKGFFGELKVEADNASKLFRHGFQPQLDKAKVIVPALKAMGGTKGPQVLGLFEDYAAKGMKDVENSVFAAFKNPIDEGKAMIGKATNAVAAPAAVVAGLSRDLGALVGQTQKDIEALGRPLPPSGDLVTEIVRKAIPDYKILGVLSMQQLVRKGLSAAEVPTINLRELPNHYEQVWEWNTRLEGTTNFFSVLDFEINPKPVKSTTGTGTGGNNSVTPVHLYIRMTTRAEIPRLTADDPANARIVQPKGRVELVGRLAFWDIARKKPLEPALERDAFALTLLKLIQVRFRELSFEAEYDVGGDPKPKLKPKLGSVEFLPPLDFVARLQEMLPFLGEGFKVVQDAARIGVRYSFQMPAIAFGAFSLRNLSIGSAAMFSLEGKPVRFDFNFSTWEQPFEITVMCFGGRGFLKIAADTTGYRDLQGALEFGGALSFDVGIASGGLYVMAGIYFRVTSSETDVSGFLRAGGCVNVLGLIHASVEFLLMVKYIKQGSESLLYGIARVTVSIDLFLVSFDVTIEMEKKLPGSGGGERTDTTRRAGRGVFQFASRQMQIEPERVPYAYFARQNSETPGRFQDAASWNRDYWSQFAF